MVRLLFNVLCALCLGMSAVAFVDEPFRPPSVPLIVSDPYLSIWSGADHAFDTTPVHWTETKVPMLALVRVDKVVYRLLGVEMSPGLCGNSTPWPAAAKQLSKQVRQVFFFVLTVVCWVAVLILVRGKRISLKSLFRSCLILLSESQTSLAPGYAT